MRDVGIIGRGGLIPALFLIASFAAREASAQQPLLTLPALPQNQPPHSRLSADSALFAAENPLLTGIAPGGTETDITDQTGILAEMRLPANAGQTLARTGASGLIRLPTTAITPDGEVRFGQFGHRGLINIRGLGNSTTYALSVGFLPRVEFGVTFGDTPQKKDITGNAKVRLLDEGGLRPALAVGVLEVAKLNGGTGDTFYGAASKHFFNGIVNVSAGVLRRADLGFRGFGGLEVGLARNVSAVMEYDSHAVNYGARVSLFHHRAQLAVDYIDGSWNVYGGIQFGLGNRRRAPQSVDVPHYAVQTTQLAASAIQKRLIALGLENVSVQIPAGTPGGNPVTLEVAYENRSFPHNPLDALANVLATAAAYAPDQVGQLTVVILRDAFSVLRVSCPLDAYRRFMAGDMEARQFGPLIRTDRDGTGAPPAGGPVTAATGRGAVSFGHADIFIRPALATEIATERFGVGLGFDIRPELDLPVTRGVGLDVRGDIPVAGPLRSAQATTDRALLQLATPIPRQFLAEASLGMFPTNRYGGLFEGLWAPANSPWLARAAVGLLDRGDSIGGQKPTYVGEARYYVPALDLNARVSFGQYLEGDTGFTVGLLRRYGDTELGLEYRDTSIGPAAVLTLGLPLGPSHLRERPETIRIRPPDFFDYDHRSLARQPNFVSIANRVGNEVDVGEGAERFLLNRDKLDRPYLLRSLPELRRILPLTAP